MRQRFASEQNKNHCKSAAAGLARWLLPVVAAAIAPLAQAYPVESQFTINSAASHLKIKATSSPFSDDDAKNLTGALSITLDFGASGFGTPATFTVNSGTVTPSGDYTLTLGFPPILGVKAVASGLAAQVSTPTPPGKMTRTAGLGVAYQIDSSQFLVTMNQGIIAVTGTTNETIDLSAAPVAGSSPAETFGTLTLTTAETYGYFTRLVAALILPVSVQQTAPVGGLSVELEVTGTVNAASSFYVALDGIPSDFQLDGDVDGADLPLWTSGFGLTAGATPNRGDANGDGAVDGADFLSWQLNWGVQPPVAAARVVAATPEPAAIGMCATALAVAALSRRSSRLNCWIRRWA